MEQFAFDALSRIMPDIRKHGLSAVLKELGIQNECGDAFRVRGFIPDGVRVRTAPRETTIELWEIEDTNKITGSKMSAIELFAMELFDLSGVFVEVHIADRYGRPDGIVYDSRTDNF